MRQIIIFITALLLFISIKGYAQIKPAQAQYLQEKGVFLNPGMEQGYKGWTITGCTKSLVDNLGALGKSLQLDCTAETFSIKQESTALAGTGLQSFGGCKVQASAAGVELDFLANGVSIQNEVIPSGVLFNRIEGEFIADAVSNGIEISGTTYTGTVIVDDCFTGMAPDAFSTDKTMQEIYDVSPQPQITVDATNLGLRIRDAATTIASNLFEIVNDAVDEFYFAVDTTWAYIQGQPIVAVYDTALDGTMPVVDLAAPNKITYTKSLQGKLNPVTDMESFTPTGSWATNATYTGYKSRIGDYLELKVKVDLTGAPDNTPLTIDIPDSLVIDTSKVLSTSAQEGILGHARYIDSGLALAMGQVSYESTTEVNVSLERITGNNDTAQLNATTPHTWASGDAIYLEFRVPIVGWTSGLDAAVQDIQLTAQTANELSFYVDFATGAVSDDLFDVVDGNCSTVSTGIVSCNWNSGIFTAAPKFINGAQQNRTNADTNDDIRSIEVQDLNTTSFRLRAKFVDPTNSGNFNATGEIFFKKAPADYNKSQVIAGTFENINSTELCQVVAYSNDGELVTGATEDIPFKTVDAGNDNCGAWSNAGNTGNDTKDAYTAPKNSFVSVNASVRMNTSTNMNVRIFVNGVEAQEIITLGGNDQDAETGASMVRLNEGDVMTLRLANGRTLSNVNADARHYINITELPDYEAIVKNLYNEKTECQTKFLQADQTSSGVMSDLTFSSLEIGKKYSATLMAYHFNTSNNTQSVLGRINSKIVIRNNFDPASSGTTSSTLTSRLECYVADNTELTFEASSVSATEKLYGNGAIDQTHVTVCELPDSTICNN